MYKGYDFVDSPKEEPQNMFYCFFISSFWDTQAKLRIDKHRWPPFGITLNDLQS